MRRSARIRLLTKSSSDVLNLTEKMDSMRKSRTRLSSRGTRSAVSEIGRSTRTNARPATCAFEAQGRTSAHEECIASSLVHRDGGNGSSVVGALRGRVFSTVPGHHAIAGRAASTCSAVCSCGLNSKQRSTCTPASCRSGTYLISGRSTRTVCRTHRECVERTLTHTALFDAPFAARDKDLVARD